MDNFFLATDVSVEYEFFQIKFQNIVLNELKNTTKNVNDNQ